MTRATKRTVYADSQASGGVGLMMPPSPSRVSGVCEIDVPGSWDLELTDAEREHLFRALAPLTPREREVACAICSGAAGTGVAGGPGGGSAGSDNEAVADRLCIALPTLRTHLMRINQKLGTSSKGDLVRFVTSRLLDGYRRGAISSPAEESARATMSGN